MLASRPLMITDNTLVIHSSSDLDWVSSMQYSQLGILLLLSSTIVSIHQCP